MKRSQEEQGLREILRRDPGSLLELLQLGKLLIEEGRLDGPTGALPVLLRSVMRMGPGNTLYAPKWASIAEVHCTLGHTEPALHAARRALEHASPKQRDIQHRTWRVARQLSDAIGYTLSAEAATGTGATPALSDILASLVELYVYLGQLKPAMDITELIERVLGKESPRAFNAIGYAYRQLGDTKASEWAYAYARQLALKQQAGPSLRKTNPPSATARKSG